MPHRVVSFGVASIQDICSCIESGAKPLCSGDDGRAIAPEGVPALNPAFDVTPHELIHAIVTEEGAIAPVDGESVAHFLARNGV